jgi:hypothetical protein
MMRLRIPQMLNDQDELNIRPKDDDDRMMGKSIRKSSQLLNAVIDWHDYTKNYESIPRERLLTSIAAFLLPTKSKPGIDVIKAYADSSSRESFIKTATLQLMSTPEYQMC